ncbi:glycosyltransferase family 32 protein [Rahnella sp. EDr1-12]|uniref:glycosyltransferase family 32 protein n=1 Tax=unclassified Rahnella TaxID=2635087 RepID=UPI003BA9A3D7
MIPKVIHYCWFGRAKKPKSVQKYIDAFHRLKPEGYEIIEWNEESYPLEGNTYLLNAYKQKKWAHVSDFVRLDVLYNYGGIYLDTDIEIVGGFEDLLNLNLFMGFMWDCNLGTAVIGVAKGNPIIQNLREKYLKEEISLSSPNNDLFTRYFLSSVSGFKLNGKEQVLPGNIKIFEKCVFEHPSLFKRKNKTIHHFSQSWKKTNKFKSRLKGMVVSVMGLYLYRKYICKKSLRISPFYERYKHDLSTK